MIAEGTPHVFFFCLRRNPTINSKHQLYQSVTVADVYDDNPDVFRQPVLAATATRKLEQSTTVLLSSVFSGHKHNTFLWFMSFQRTDAGHTRLCCERQLSNLCVLIFIYLYFYNILYMLPLLLSSTDCGCRKESRN